MNRKLVRASIAWKDDAYEFKALFEDAGKQEDHTHLFKDRAAMLGFIADVLPDRFETIIKPDQQENKE